MSNGLPWAETSHSCCCIVLGGGGAVWPSWEGESIGSLQLDSLQTLLSSSYDLTV